MSVLSNEYTAELYIYSLYTHHNPPKSSFRPPNAPAAHFLPVAASLTLNFPAAMSLTVARISLKSSKVVNGTFSLSHHVTRSAQ